mmetsp:Transcript_78669/g.156415  ORF Transcript_78669/g.156415 Transcript_78669/m.156415 type:complete len:251 (+) Transcript_78669:115-867(+)
MVSPRSHAFCTQTAHNIPIQSEPQAQQSIPGSDITPLPREQHFRTVARAALWHQRFEEPASFFEDGIDDCRDGGRLLVRIHRRVESTLCVVVHHRLCLLVECPQTLRQRGLVVILAPRERLAGQVVAHGHLRRSKFLVVGTSRGRMDQSAADALHEHFVRDLELDHVVNFADLFVRKHLVEHDRLWHGARKAIENKALGARWRCDVVLDDAHHNVVRDQTTRLHHRLCLLAHLRSSSDGSAQQIASGEVA